MTKGASDMLLNTLISVLPMSVHIDHLKRSIQDYQSDPTDQNLDLVLHGCHSIMVKTLLNAKGGEKNPLSAVEDLAEEMERLKKASEFFNTDKN